MSKNTGNTRWLAPTLLAVALTACGTIQGATPGGAVDRSDTSDSAVPSRVLQQAIELDRQKEQQRLAQQGLDAVLGAVDNSASPLDDSSRDTRPTLVP
jgi:hypothetical protein